MWSRPTHSVTTNSCVSVRLSTWHQEGSMDSLYEAVQSSSDGPPPPIPSRSSSRTCSRTCSRSCSPAVLLDDNTNKWRGSGRSISMVRGLRTHVHHTSMSYRRWAAEPCEQSWADCVGSRTHQTVLMKQSWLWNDEQLLLKSSDFNSSLSGELKMYRCGVRGRWGLRGALKWTDYLLMTEED